MCTGAGQRSFLTAQLCIEGTVSHRAPNLVQPTGRHLGMTWSDWLSQHLGVVGPKCIVTGGGATGRMHSKPQGFSTQPIAQPATSMLVLAGHLSITFGYIEDPWAQYPRCVPNREGRGVYVATGHLGAIPEGPSEYMIRSSGHITRGADTLETSA